MGDTAFASYVHFALLLPAKLHGVFRRTSEHWLVFAKIASWSGNAPRAPGRRANSRLVRKLGRYDQVVQYRKPPSARAG